jgi:hypothetical protein
MNTPTLERRTATPEGIAATAEGRQPETTDLNDRFNQKISVCKIQKGAMFIQRDITVMDALEEIRGDRYAAAVAKLRKLVSLHGKKSVVVKTVKNALPAFLPSGWIDGRVKNAMDEGRFHHSGLLQLDFDKLADPAAIRDQVAQDPHVLAAWVSPSGDGVKGLMVIKPAATEDSHLAAFLTAEAYWHDRGLTLDAQCKNSNRLMFASHDPDLQFNDEAVQLATTPPPKTAKPSPSIKVGSKHTKREELTAQDVREMLAAIPSRPSYEEWLKIASAVWDALGESEGTAALCEWSPEEHAGEYAQKYRGRLERVTAGTLVHIAREHGWKRERSKSTPSASTRTAGSDIPEDVFPIPGSGVSYTESAEIIFPAMGEARKLFIREREVHEIHSTIESDILAPVSPERFSSLVESTHRRVARREVKQKDGADSVVWRTTTFPSSSAKILLQTNSARTALPTISQLANCPILTPDGHVLSRGYHKHAGGTYIGRGGKLQEVPFDTAVESLIRLLIDFDFATESDASRAFASLISPALKQGGWIDDDFPLDLAEADQSQSGKTFRQKIVCLIYNEQQYSITSQKGGVGSLDEAVAAALIKGRPFITIDNFRGRMDSQIMEAAIRGAGVVDCRTIKHRAEVNTRPFLWQLSTNGAELTRDLANRSIVTRIRKRPDGIVWHAHPEGSLDAHIRANQCFYLACVFAILREWSRQGRPITGESRHDFRTWCRTLDGIVQMVGMSPLLDGHREQQLRTANPNLQWLREILLAMDDQDVGRELYTSDLVRIAEDNEIAFPGNPHSKDDPAVRAGRILRTLFKDSVDEKIEVDGIEFSRSSAPDYSPERLSRETKKYTVKKP